MMEDHGELVVKHDKRVPEKLNKLGHALFNAAVAIERAMEEMDYVTRIAREALELPPVPARKVGLEFLKDHRKLMKSAIDQFKDLSDEEKLEIIKKTPVVEVAG